MALAPRLLTALLAASSLVSAQALTGKALQKALHDPAADFWIYDDIAKGYAEAKKTGKPLLISFRCVP